MSWPKQQGSEATITAEVSAGEQAPPCGAPCCQPHHMPAVTLTAGRQSPQCISEGEHTDGRRIQAAWHRSPRPAFPRGSIIRSLSRTFWGRVTWQGPLAGPGSGQASSILSISLFAAALATYLIPRDNLWPVKHAKLGLFLSTWW